MALELPALTAALARLPDSTIHLAAFGGIAFPFAMLIESPIVMLLSASTELCRDLPSYRLMYRVMMRSGLALTVLHLMFAVTPLFDLVLGNLIRMPAELVEPTRQALLLLTPWTWAIAYRRFHQGVLIRYGRSRVVGFGTAIRLGSGVTVLCVGLYLQSVSGVAVAAMAVVAGVVSEALFIGIMVRPVVNGELAQSPIVTPALTHQYFFKFYIPLALTSVVGFLVQPLGSAAMSRMPNPVDSLALWPIVAGLTFVFRCFGLALNEVVVALIDLPGASRKLQRFTLVLAVVTSSLAALITFSAVGPLIFTRFFGLNQTMTEFAIAAFILALPTPALSAYQSWYQGLVLNSRRTRSITEAVSIYLVTSAVLLFLGIVWPVLPGVKVSVGAIAIAMFAQLVYLRRSALRHFREKSKATAAS